MTNKVTAIIVDDEKDSRESLHSFLHKYCPTVKVVGQASNIIEAKDIIDKTKPQLVFLDIEMPYGNGFDLLESLDVVSFEVIFITAFSEYAIQALNLSAAHYLLKPIDIEELILAVDKVNSRILNANILNHNAILVNNIRAINAQNQKVVLPKIDGFEVKKVNEILYCEADDNFTKFYFKDGKTALICRKLKFYEELLSPFDFCRIHRSTMINLEYVVKYIKGKGGQVILSNGKSLDISQTRKQQFLASFKSA